MDKRDILVIGAPAGGVTALLKLFGGMPAGVSATVFVVQHIAASARSHLPQLLARAGWLPAFHPEDGDPVRPGRPAYVTSSAEAVLCASV